MVNPQKADRAGSAEDRRRPSPKTMDGVKNPRSFWGETVGGWVQDGAPKCDGYVGLQPPGKKSLVVSTGNHS